MSHAANSIRTPDAASPALCSGGVVRRLLVCESQRAQTTKKNGWVLTAWDEQSRRVLEDWEWRALLHFSWLPPELRKQRLVSLAEEAAAHLTHGIDNLAVREQARTAIVNVAREDAEPPNIQDEPGPAMPGRNR